MATSKIKRGFASNYFSFPQSTTEDEMFATVASTIAEIGDSETIPICIVWDNHDYYVGVGAKKWSAVRILVANGTYLHLITASTSTTPPTVSSKKRVQLTAY